MSNTTGGIVRPAIVVFALLSALTGLIYPMAVTGAAKAAFPAQAAGSLIVLDGTTGACFVGTTSGRPVARVGGTQEDRPPPIGIHQASM